MTQLTLRGSIETKTWTTVTARLLPSNLSSSDRANMHDRVKFCVALCRRRFGINLHGTE